VSNALVEREPLPPVLLQVVEDSYPRSGPKSGKERRSLQACCVNVSQTAQTWALVIATVGAALLAVIITFIGTSYQQRAQAAREARARQDAALAELLAAAEDLVLSVRAIWFTYADGAGMFRWRNVGVFWRATCLIYRAHPAELPTTWRGWMPQNPLKNWRMLARMLARQATDVNLIEAALDMQQELRDLRRMVSLDMATVLSPRLARYSAVAALLTLGEDKEIADSVRKLTSKITEVPPFGDTAREEFMRLASEAQQALDEFRAEVDKRGSKRAKQRSNDREAAPFT
jgi:hypothetical protein